MASVGTDGREVSNIDVCKWCGDLLERWHCVGLVEWYNGDVTSERKEVDTEKGERMETRDQGVVFGWSRGAGVLRGEVQTPAKPHQVCFDFAGKVCPDPSADRYKPALMAKGIWTM